MDLTNSTITPTPTLAKTPETETEINRIQPAKPSPFTNGVLKRHAPVHHAPPHHLNHHHHHHHPVVVSYRECLKNHAAGIGGHAVDGCGEFMPAPAVASPTELKCAACGCHRNFHRREPDSPPHVPPLPALEYHPHHRHHPPPPPPARTDASSSPNNSPSPPPISSAYYPPSAPHMLVALSHVFSGPPPPESGTTTTPLSSSPNGRKRFRTKFTSDQKGKMLDFADKVGWKMQKRDEDLISNFCSEIGVDKSVFKVWMHNNKNTFGKKEDLQGTLSLTPTNGNENGSGYSGAPMGGAAEAVTEFSGVNFNHHRESNNGTNNGSSSSS